jgi:hypothetical protein
MRSFLRSIAIAGSLLVLFSSGARAEAVTTPLFELELPGDWKLVSQNDSGIYRLASEEKHVAATIEAQEWSPSDLDQAAHSLLKLRMTAEESHMKQAERTANYTDSVDEVPVGFQMEYYGEDSAKRQFRFWGLAAEAKVVTLYVEAYDQSEAELDRNLEVLLAGLKL